jgi:hypothetical protein
LPSKPGRGIQDAPQRRSASSTGTYPRERPPPAKHPKQAESLFLRGIKSGHIPSTLQLCRFYRRGERGFAKGILGHLLFPFAWLYVWVTTRFMIFSIRVFQHFNLEVPPMFNERALR